MSGVETEDTTEAGFKIDGTLYEIPALDSFDMDEAQILWDSTGMALEDFVPPGGEDVEPEEIEEYQEKLSHQVKNPAFLRVLMHVAYRRGNPKLPEGRIKDVVRSVNHLDAMVDFLRSSQAKGDRRPPESTTEQPQSSGRSSDDSSASSGSDSTVSSVAPESTPDPTGISESDTSAEQDRTVLAS